MEPLRYAPASLKPSILSAYILPLPYNNIFKKTRLSSKLSSKKPLLPNGFMSRSKALPYLLCR